MPYQKLYRRVGEERTKWIMIIFQPVNGSNIEGSLESIRENFLKILCRLKIGVSSSVKIAEKVLQTSVY